MWNLKYATNKPIIKQKHTHRHRERICGCQGGRWGRGGLGVGVSRCKLSHMERMGSKVRLCSTGNCSQCSGINCNGKQCKKECTYTYNWVTAVEKAMAPHSSTLAWKIPWMEEPGGLQSMGSLRVGHDWATSLSFFTFMHWRRKWQPTPVLLPGGSQGRESLWAAVYGVAQSRTRLNRLSSSNSSSRVTAVWQKLIQNYKSNILQLIKKTHTDLGTW